MNTGPPDEVEDRHHITVVRIRRAGEHIDASRKSAKPCMGVWGPSQSGKSTLTFETSAGILNCWKGEDGLFTVDMGKPRFAWNEIPLAEKFRALHVFGGRTAERFAQEARKEHAP